MGKQLAKKITWVIKNFSSLRLEKIYSDQFIVGGCKWRLLVYPKGNNTDYLFLYLEVADYESLSPGWRRQAQYLLNIINQNSVKRSKHNEAQKWFDVDSPRWGRLFMFSLNEINAKDSGLLNGELKIVAEIEVLEVIGNLDVSEEPSTIMETMDFNGFQLLPSQVEFVSNMFERHPEIAFEFRLKNPNLRAGYMSLLLSLIETLRQAPHELSKADLAEACAALKSMSDVGFQLGWLEKKRVEMLERKEKEEACEIRMQEIEEELQDLKCKCSDLEAQLEREKSEVLAAKAPLSFDDVF
ncbi:MATH domain and coiled-coil domain-containing protein [Cardamine amara subsp. amara]|uniref:MATH domain and coiled-coil domain-containing protein n=1 Tax=Cardamine amara subsp. amara TaxID=228776 RepID=A0ABD1C8K8_CARAN